jgi:hypothetical protein
MALSESVESKRREPDIVKTPNCLCKRFNQSLGSALGLNYDSLRSFLLRNNHSLLTLSQAGQACRLTEMARWVLAVIAPGSVELPRCRLEPEAPRLGFFPSRGLGETSDMPPASLPVYIFTRTVSP